MDQRRFIVFLVLSMVLMVAWGNLGPRLFPGLFPKPQPVAQKPIDDVDQPANDIDAILADDGQPDDPDADPIEGNADNLPGIAAADDGADDAADAPVKEDDANGLVLPQHPPQTVTLGSLDPESKFYLEVELTSQGAAVSHAKLNDPRFRDLNDRNAPVSVVGNQADTKFQTLQTVIAPIETQLKKLGSSLRTIDWEVVEGSQSTTEVMFRLVSPDKQWEVRKHYHLRTGEPGERDTNPEGYLLDFDLTIANLSDQPSEVSYTLQGPVGVPLEDVENARNFQEAEYGFLEDVSDPDSIDTAYLGAAAIIKEQDKAASKDDPSYLTIWRSPMKYVGIDSQYFAALVIPEHDLATNRYFDKTTLEVISKHKVVAQSEISVALTSVPFVVPPGSNNAVSHDFKLYFGPKRDKVLEPLGATGVIQFGWFRWVSIIMLDILEFFHHKLHLPYALAIILLTVCVRALMFPISVKQAGMSKKMKELQPKIQELKTKYADDQQKFAQAQMELYRKHNFFPLAGCLPALLQLPIFFGLYQSLYNAIDLRLAPFLWIDNLASPDALFSFRGFEVPFLGWTEFNLLPLIAIALFLLQQKMFAPPAQSEEQQLQMKMMNMMMVVFGVMFYRVPAGLCLYFIASSLWALAERKMLDFRDKRGGDATDLASDDALVANVPAKPAKKAPKAKQPKDPGLFARLIEAADEARNQAAPGAKSKEKPKEKNGKKRSGNRKKKPRGRR